MKNINTLAKQLFWKKMDVCLLSIALAMVFAIAAVKSLRFMEVLYTDATKANDLALASSIVFAFILLGMFSPAENKGALNADS